MGRVDWGGVGWSGVDGGVRVVQKYMVVQHIVHHITHHTNKYNIVSNVSYLS